MTDNKAQDLSDRVHGAKGRCPECGSSALLFLYADGRTGDVLRWWVDGRPDLVFRHPGEKVEVSREEYGAAVEAAPERDPEYPDLCGALSCGACGEEFDKPEFVDEID